MWESPFLKSWPLYGTQAKMGSSQHPKAWSQSSLLAGLVFQAKLFLDVKEVFNRSPA
jgi:hypothetical protein